MSDNTVAHSAGRVCYPGFVDALRASVRLAEVRPTYDAWWPGATALRQIGGPAEAVGRTRITNMRWGS